MKPKFDIVAEPKGPTYIDLLRFAASRCESFSLVWRDQFKFEQSADRVKRALEPFLIANVRTDEWPGTTLIGHKAMVRRYRIEDAAVRVLRQPGSLYSWLQPNLPEDLAFYSSGGDVWMASISHEHDAWFTDPSLSRAEISTHVLGLEIKVHAA